MSRNKTRENRHEKAILEALKRGPLRTDAGIEICLRFQARLHSLREKGHIIETAKDPAGTQMGVYVYRGWQEPGEQPEAQVIVTRYPSGRIVVEPVKKTDPGKTLTLLEEVEKALDVDESEEDPVETFSFEKHTTPLPPSTKRVEFDWSTSSPEDPGDDLGDDIELEDLLDWWR